MDSPGQTPNVKTEHGRVAGGGPSPARRVPRAFPKPPAFLPRFLMLCLRPESWAEAARYPTHVTLVPLILAILLGAVVATAGQTYRQVRGLEEFAATYDQYYPPMELSSDGVLSVKGALKGPVRVPLLGMDVLVDPTGQTNPETVAWGRVGALVTDKSVVVLNRFTGELASEPLKTLGSETGLLHLPAQGRVQVVDGKTIGAFVGNLAPVMLVVAPLVAMLQALGEALWAAAMLFLMMPVVVLTASVTRVESGARMVILPRRAAFRIVAGYLVPLVLAGAALKATGHSVGEVLGWNAGLLIWFAAALGLAIWTGILARRMYGAKKQARD
jgi:hypothetical protein